MYKKKIFLSLIVLCFITAITTGCTFITMQKNRDTALSYTAKVQPLSSDLVSPIAYETLLYGKISSGFEYEWNNPENLSQDLKSIIEEYKNTIGAFIVKSNEKEYYICINSEKKPSSDYGFKIQKAYVIKNTEQPGNGTLKITADLMKDDSGFTYHKADTSTLQIIRIDKNKLPENMIVQDVLISFNEMHE